MPWALFSRFFRKKTACGTAWGVEAEPDEV